MGRKDNFNMGHGWSFPVNPLEVVERTKKGGYTVDLKTGEEPKTGTMVSIPGHEQAVPISNLTPKAVTEYGEMPEKKELLSSPGMFLGTWRSSDDKSVGDAGFLDISQNFTDNAAGAQLARKAAMEGAQWGLWNIDREVTESNIANPNVVENIKEEQKIEIPETEVSDYLESEHPVGQHLPLGYLTEPKVISRGKGRRKKTIPAGQMTFLEIASKPNYD